jgi:hypothetical protein
MRANKFTYARKRLAAIGKYDQALLSYEDYLRKATNLPEADRGQVEKSIAELRAKLASTAPPSRIAAAAAAIRRDRYRAATSAIGDRSCQ